MTFYYEVWPADSRYHGDSVLTYASEYELTAGQVVSVPLRDRIVTAFVAKAVSKPGFKTKTIKNRLSETALPAHVLPLAQWLRTYYATNLGEVLRQFAPSKPVVRRRQAPAGLIADPGQLSAALAAPLTKDQRRALTAIKRDPRQTCLLHGATGSGKTRVYLELANTTLASGRSVILLTPEIALTSQLLAAAEEFLGQSVRLWHSGLSQAGRKELWFELLEAKQPVVVIGPRSALFSPVQKLGLIVVDEAHEPAYKQQQSPRYHAVRVASQLGALSGAKVLLGSATPNLVDYCLADRHHAVVTMTQLARGDRQAATRHRLVDLRDKTQLSTNSYFSKVLTDEIATTLSKKQQILIYHNRRGSARLILCRQCGWQARCPRCDIQLVYHADSHLVVCHSCNWRQPPQSACPQCANPDIVYKSAGSKAIASELVRLFPQARLKRFDSDNLPGEQVQELYPQLRRGQIDILVGTQLLAKGLDLPKLGLVGVINAETSLSLPDFSSEERSFQLLYQVMGRVGRGHTPGLVVVQSYDPDSQLIKAAIGRNYKQFYDQALAERRSYRFPPFVQLMQLTCRRATSKAAETAAVKLRQRLSAIKLSVEIIGPTPNFYSRQAGYYRWQVVIKSKRRQDLLRLAELVPSDWTIDLDPTDLL